MKAGARAALAGAALGRAALAAVLTAGLAAMLTLSGCEKAARNMYDQPKYRPLVASSLWPDGQSARGLPEGVVAHGAGVLAGDSSGERGELASEPAAERANPVPVTLGLLRRGRERYDIYCAPCHSVTGDGDGMAVRRGFPRPASLHTETARRSTDAHLYEVITAGYGVMFPFEDRIVPPDRWAIVAYIRALQLSRNAPLAALAPADLEALAKEGK